MSRDDLPSLHSPVPPEDTQDSPEDGLARAVLYLRVSTKDQAKKGGEEEGFSIPAQREAGRRRAAALGAAIVNEFVDAGESAKSARRPELQRMLAYVRENPVDYVIVHKVDRLARNRADDVEITLAIRAAGAKLVSCTENIDETPSGILLHGIMSSIAEFYSRNLANEVAKGLVQKAKTGGTPGKAPLGYSNVRRFENGREIRTIAVDPVRAPHVRWAFEAYASGEWRLQPLCDELNRRGLDVPATRSKPVTRLHVSRLHWMLKSPYYKGIVSYRGVDYPGAHEPLVSADVWQRVQDVLAAHNHVGEKQRQHNHYLKSSLYCGHCGSRMIVSHSRSRTGRVYGYFICIGKHQRRTDCTVRAIAIERVEQLVEEHYATVEIPKEIRSILEPNLQRDLLSYYSEARSFRTRSEKRRSRLLEERTKLLEAHYAGAIPIDLLRSEQQRITKELDTISAQLAQIDDHQALVETNLRRALALAEDCQSAYHTAPPSVRRRFNQVFFKRLYVEDHDTVRSELAPPFAALLAHTSAIEAETPDIDWSAALEHALNDRDPEAWGHGVAGVKEPKLVAGAVYGHISPTASPIDSRRFGGSNPAEADVRLRTPRASKRAATPSLLERESAAVAAVAAPGIDCFVGGGRGDDESGSEVGPPPASERVSQAGRRSRAGTKGSPPAYGTWRYSEVVAASPHERQPNPGVRWSRHDE